MNYEEEIQKLKRELASLTAMMHQNNFMGSQDFNKVCRFNSTLKVPRYSSAPATSEVGQIIEIGGKLYISTAVNTFTLVGSQT